ncbi:hypothetical protein EES46_23780 [Streptomyces sp. ADI98-10]|nr:hypothetical protein EES46_23780 [Streptomyces sp. ADI98-10]
MGAQFRAACSDSPEDDPARPDLAIVLHTPLPGTGCEAGLQWLASPEGRRGSMCPGPG